MSQIVKSDNKAMKAKITNEELNAMLCKHGLDLHKLCDYIEMKTGNVIAPKNVRKALACGDLSHPMSAAIRFAFLLREATHGQKVQ